MNWKCYHLRKKWLVERGVEGSQASEQAMLYVLEEERKEEALIMGK